MDFLGDFKELPLNPKFAKSELSGEPWLRNPVCGDEVRVKVELTNSAIAGYGYEARGCWPVLSCLEWLGQRFLGRNVFDALRFELEEFFAQVNGIPAGKRHAFSLSHRAFRRALITALGEAGPESVEAIGPPRKERV